MSCSEHLLIFTISEGKNYILSTQRRHFTFELFLPFFPVCANDFVLKSSASPPVCRCDSAGLTGSTGTSAAPCDASVHDRLINNQYTSDQVEME